MNLKERCDLLTALVCGLAVILFVGWLGYTAMMDVRQTWVHWSEPYYVIPASYDPLFAGLTRDVRSISCMSPTRCEPDGKPNPHDFLYKKGYEVRELGLDQLHMIPEP